MPRTNKSKNKNKNNNSRRRAPRPPPRVTAEEILAARNLLEGPAQNAAYRALMRGAELNMGARSHNLKNMRKTMKSVADANKKLLPSWTNFFRRNLPPELGAALLTEKEGNSNAQRNKLKNAAQSLNAARLTAAMQAAYAPQPRVYMPSAARRALEERQLLGETLVAAVPEVIVDPAPEIIALSINNRPFRVGNNLARRAAAAPFDLRVVSAQQAPPLSPAEILQLIPPRRRNRAV